MTRIWEIVRMIRSLRAESGIKPGEIREVILIIPMIYRISIEANIALISGLTRTNVILEEKSIK